MSEYKELGYRILSRKEELARIALDRQYAQNPHLLEKWGKTGWDRCLEDTEYHISYLSESIMANSTDVFVNYVNWARSLFENIGIQIKYFKDNLKLLGEVLIDEIPEAGKQIKQRINLALNILDDDYIPEESFIDTSNPLGSSAKEYLNRLLKGKRSIAVQYILNLVESGISIKDIYSHIFQPTQYEIGRLWQTGKISVAQEHYATAVTQLAMSQLYPKIFATPKNGKTMIATCPTGELHEIGIRMLADFFELSGWDTYFLGANTPNNSILQSIDTQNPDIVAISATMTFHLSKVEDLINYIRKSDYANTKIIVGGYVFKSVPDLWKEVGANGFAPDAEKALDLVNNLN